MIETSIKALLGFARKGNLLVSGETAVEAGLKNQQIKLLIMAEDLPSNKFNYLQKWCRDLDLPCITLGNKEELGNALGLSPRGMIGITDEKMAAAILAKTALEK